MSYRPDRFPIINILTIRYWTSYFAKWGVQRSFQRASYKASLLGEIAGQCSIFFHILNGYFTIFFSDRSLSLSLSVFRNSSISNQLNIFVYFENNLFILITFLAFLNFCLPSQGISFVHNLTSFQKNFSDVVRLLSFQGDISVIFDFSRNAFFFSIEPILKRIKHLPLWKKYKTIRFP